MRAKICQIVNNSAGDCLISIKFSTDYDYVPHGTCSRSEGQSSNCNNSAADCPIALKCRTEFHYGIAGTLQVFKVEGQGQVHGIKVQGHSVT